MQRFHHQDWWSIDVCVDNMCFINLYHVFFFDCRTVLKISMYENLTWFLAEQITDWISLCCKYSFLDGVNPQRHYLQNQSECGHFLPEPVIQSCLVNPCLLRVNNLHKCPVMLLTGIEAAMCTESRVSPVSLVWPLTTGARCLSMPLEAGSWADQGMPTGREAATCVEHHLYWTHN